MQISNIDEGSAGSGWLTALFSQSFRVAPEVRQVLQLNVGQGRLDQVLGDPTLEVGVQ